MSAIPNSIGLAYLSSGNNPNLSDSEIIQRIANNQKPGGTICAESLQEAEQAGLFVRPVNEFMYAVSKPISVESLFGAQELVDWFKDLDGRLEGRIRQLHRHFGPWKIAAVLSALLKYPTVDDEIASLNGRVIDDESLSFIIDVEAIERPEVAAITGVLFGYSIEGIREYMKRVYVFEGAK